MKTTRMPQVTFGGVLVGLSVFLGLILPTASNSQTPITSPLSSGTQTRLANGDLLLIDASAKHFGGFGVYVLEVSGERLVKRVQPKLDGSLTLISDNPAYEPEHIPPSQAADILVIGRVVWTCGPTRGTR